MLDRAARRRATADRGPTTDDGHLTTRPDLARPGRSSARSSARTPRFDAVEVADVDRGDHRAGPPAVAGARLPRRAAASGAFTQADADAVSTLLGVVDDGCDRLRHGGQPDPRRRADHGPAGRLGGRHPGPPGRRSSRPATTPPAAGSAALRLVEALNGPFEQLLIYAWRRHLAAAVARVEALGANEEDLHTTQVTVGFADIVSFTALSNQLDHDRIGDLVEIFESRCADVVAGRTGPGDQEHRRLGALRERGPDPRLRHRRGDHRGGRPRPPDARRPRRAGHRLGRDAARRRLRAAGQHGRPADRGRPAQPGHRRPRRPPTCCRRGPVRVPAAAGPAGARASGSSSRSPYAGTEPDVGRGPRPERWSERRVLPSSSIGSADPRRVGFVLPFDRVLEVQDVRARPRRPAGCGAVTARSCCPARSSTCCIA